MNFPPPAPPNISTGPEHVTRLPLTPPQIATHHTLTRTIFFSCGTSTARTTLGDIVGQVHIHSLVNHVTDSHLRD